MLYLVNITPREPYTLGTDIGFAMKDANVGKTSYFMQSHNVPDQTTVLGILRYLVLEHNDLLHTDFKYSKEDQEKMAEKIGKKSFSFMTREKQTFGSIHSISPIFLMDKDNNYYVKNPFHNKLKKEDKEQYLPIQLSDIPLNASGNAIYLPKEKEFDAKEGHAGGYFNLDKKCVVETDELIETTVLSGNKKSVGQSDKKDSFFKREVKYLKTGFSFAIFVQADSLPENSIAYMGYRRAVCTVSAKEVSKDDLVEKVRTAFSTQQTDKQWQYALSDILPVNSLSFDTFCIVEKKQVRNLETVYENSNVKSRTRKMNVQYNLIESGSVFYNHCNIECNENGTDIGYNKIVEIGG